MGRWMFGIVSIIFFKLTLNAEVTKLCRKKASVLGGEELICHDVSVLFFANFSLILNKTHWLTCESCYLYIIDEHTFNITRNNITFLYLISSKIHTVKDLAFGRFESLKVISLRNNSIAELSPKAFTNLKKLTHADLSHNELEVLINNIFAELPALSFLNLNHNKIRHIQLEAFAGLSVLKHLHLNNNQIEKLDSHVFAPLYNLLLLYLENNNIHQIDTFAFTNLTDLHYLYLNNNSINFLVQYNFKPLHNLVDLQLRDNHLTEIQISSFNGLTNLKSLHLGNNKLKSIKRYGFVGLDSLHTLELINNDFEKLDLSYIEYIQNLQMLWLQHNHISSFNIDFKMDPMDSVHSLGLSYNNLTILNYKVLHNKMPNLKDIYVTNNTWRCELLVNMFNYFQNKRVNLCVSDNCDLNRTKHYIEDVCVAQHKGQEEEDEDEEGFDTDLASEVASSFKISVILVLLEVFVFT